MLTQVSRALALGASAAIAVVSAASAETLDFKLTGAGAGTGVEWTSNSSINTLENSWTAGQGDWIFTSLLTTNSQSVANLLTQDWWYTGTALGVLIGKAGSYGVGGDYVEFASTGTPIFTYTGGLSGSNRPYNATFSVGSWTLKTFDTYTNQFGSGTLTVSAVPGPTAGASIWGLLVLAAYGLRAQLSRLAKRRVGTASYS